MTYEQRWGHKRFRKAVKHLEIKALKRKQAEERNAKYRALSLAEKLQRKFPQNKEDCYGAQEPPNNPMVYNRRMPDGTFRPIAGFFDGKRG